MDILYDDLDLIDLINTKYEKLRKTNETMQSISLSISITHSEWSILSLIYGKQPAISEIAQQVDITRQATHKCIKSLNSKGIINIKNVENNNRNKCLSLTSLGEQCFLENEAIKEVMENDIADKIGIENVSHLKILLQQDWG